MKIGEQLALIAMKKEFKRLTRAADRAKENADEYMEIGTEAIAIHQEFVEIVKSGERGENAIKKLDILKKRSERVERIRKKDLLTLINKQSDAEIARDSLGSEIQMTDILKAPWTPEQIEKLDKRQEDETKHPYTCQCGHSLEPFPSGWFCENQCGYTQDWCHKADAI